MIKGKNYDDIINLPHHKSVTRKHMPLADRAAQFAPFSALTGYDAAVRETARLTEKRIELDEYEKEKINIVLTDIKNRLKEKPVIKTEYYIPDEKKSGGRYVEKTCVVSKIREIERTVTFDDGTEVPIENILSVNII